MNEQKKERREDELLDHEYDGIREQNNPLPAWWLATFYGTILFSMAYLAYYEIGPGPTLLEEFRAEHSALLTAQKSKKVPFPVEETLAGYLKDDGARDLGAKLYAKNCVSCHAEKGQGLVGPNLTDNAWIIGRGTPMEIAQVVHDGVLDKGMPPWNAMLKHEQIYQLVSFVVSLKGTNPPGAKPPQGNLVND
jgi:cytochrome c oxidase cbb3-type subunit 3